MISEKINSESKGQFSKCHFDVTSSHARDCDNRGTEH